MTKKMSELALISHELKTPGPWALMFAAAAMAFQAHNGFWPLIGASTAFGFLLAVQSLVDLRTKLLPHSLNLTIFALGMVIAPHYTYVTLFSGLAAAGLLFTAFLAMGMLSTRLAGKPALGAGDLYLVTALGPWLGLGGVPLFLLLIAILGIGMLMLQRLVGIRRKKTETYPFGPILAAAAWLAYLYQYLYWQCISFLIT